MQPDPQPNATAQTAAPASAAVAAAPGETSPALPSRARWLTRVCRQPRRTLTALAALTALAVAGWLLGRQAWAAYHWRAAQAAAARFQYEQAKRHVQICHAVWPDDPATLLLAARVARRVKRYDEANELLTRYRQIRGEDDDLNLERIMFRAENGDVDDVSELCRTLVDQRHPQSNLLLEALIAGYLRLLRTQEAGFCIHLWQALDPDAAQPIYLQGFIHEMRVESQEALQAYRRVVELDPEHDEARYRLAYVLLELSQAPEAYAHLERLQARQPENAATLVEMARCLDKLQRQADAEKLLDRALELEPHNATVLFERGALALRLDQVPSAEAWLRQAANLMPGDYSTNYQLSQCCHRLGKADEARALQVKLKQIEEDSKRLRAIISREMSLTPNDPNLLFELGMIHMRSGADKEGVRWFQAALKADPNHEATHEAFARYYQATGQIGRAAKHLEFVKSKSGAGESANKIGGPFP